ncbi:MAG: FkbM family methyltransferase [Gammaproteobacteria bacterium]|nr:FkbM family methyltransferase [Gammaproteobacteria bacterium]
MGIKHEVRKILWKLGYDLSRFEPGGNSLARRKKLLETFGIDVVFDVGANRGFYAREMRTAIGYSGKIVSFEPLSGTFSQLQKTSSNDKNWIAVNCALGDKAGKVEINVSDNTYSSSLLPMMKNHLDSAPYSKYVRTETVEVKTIDDIFDDYCSSENNIYLKIDSQGYEEKILKGAKNRLSLIDTVQLEMSLVPLYEGELLFGELHKLLTEKGYTLVSFEEGFHNPKTGQLLQVDGIYHRFSE